MNCSTWLSRWSDVYIHLFAELSKDCTNVALKHKMTMACINPFALLCSIKKNWSGSFWSLIYGSDWKCTSTLKVTWKCGLALLPVLSSLLQRKKQFYWCTSTVEQVWHDLTECTAFSNCFCYFYYLLFLTLYVIHCYLSGFPHCSCPQKDVIWKKFLFNRYKSMKIVGNTH